MAKLRTRTATRRAMTWDPLVAMLTGIGDGPTHSETDDRAFYEQHRDRLLAEWSQPDNPHLGFWRFDPRCPERLRERSVESIDMDETAIRQVEQLEAERRIWWLANKDRICPA